METQPMPARDAADAQEARRHVKRLRSFYQLLLVAVLVVVFTAAVNLLQGGRIWFHWVIFGFGIALAFSALDAFGRDLWLGRAWQERKEREYLARRRS